MGKPKSKPQTHSQRLTTPLASKPIKITKPAPKPTSQNHLSFPPPPPRVEQPSRSDKGMEEEGGKEMRVPLSEVVSECVTRWFSDTLKEAKAGDAGMQVLVAQMYFNGYGVIRDPQKGRIWTTRASRVRSSAWKVSGKRPGYTASDSDSDDLIDES